ncbi:hypothetical protein WH91_02165, partial [Devosia psychrophila]
RQGPALGIVQQRNAARRDTIDQAIRAGGVEPQYPVPHGLKTNTAHPRRLTPPAALINRRHRQQASHMVAIPARPRQRP